MGIRSRIEEMMRPLVIVVGAACGVGALASLFIVLVRLPAIASSKLDLLFGTLLGTAVGLLFGLVALMVNLTYLVHRAKRALISN
jgi:thiamine transporter ThiT